ncbi:MAG: iron-containing alcohol dehydrogenase [Desulfobulbaceae bacterium]|nr:iron-containing alcohol dehydrogenase [Desulfobulbaceae bacterium]
MQNFVFHNTTKILFGRNTVASIGSETAAWGSRALLVYGMKSIKKNGVYGQIVSSLHDAGLEITEHGGVCSNPLLSHVRLGIEKAKNNNIDVIVAAGGGSVIDSAKAISAGALVEHDVWKFFTGKKSIKKTIPLTTVLTLAAAGSEMNSGMVITNDDTRKKFGFGNQRLYPKTSILNPEVTFSVPPSYTAYGAVDAVAHVLEFYMTATDPATPVQDRLMEGLIENAMDSCDRCLESPEDYNGRADLMWTATLALNGLTAAGLGKVGFPMHMIEHSLSALYDIPHGAGLSIIIPGWLKWFSATNPARIAQLARRIFPTLDCEDYTDKEMAQRGITILQNWFARIDSPSSLQEVEIPIADIPEIAANAVALAKVWRLKEYTRERIEEILHLCR